MNTNPESTQYVGLNTNTAAAVLLVAMLMTFYILYPLVPTPDSGRLVNSTVSLCACSIEIWMGTSRHFRTRAAMGSCDSTICCINDFRRIRLGAGKRNGFRLRITDRSDLGTWLYFRCCCRWCVDHRPHHQCISPVLELYNGYANSRIPFWR